MTIKKTKIAGHFSEFNDYINEITPQCLAERIDSIQIEYSLAVVEGHEAGNKYPDAARNLRFLHELRFQADCLVDDSERNTNE